MLPYKFNNFIITTLMTSEKHFFVIIFDKTELPIEGHVCFVQTASSVTTRRQLSERFSSAAVDISRCDALHILIGVNTCVYVQLSTHFES